jgi:hypothetical protein
VSGRAKARREAKAADRIARGKQRAHAELTRRWHLRVVDESTRMNAGLANALYEQFVKTANSEGVVKEVNNTVYEPHCLMSWEEMKAGADDMAGVPNALNGDAT